MCTAWGSEGSAFQASLEALLASLCQAFDSCGSSAPTDPNWKSTTSSGREKVFGSWKSCMVDILMFPIASCSEDEEWKPGGAVAITSTAPCCMGRLASSSERLMIPSGKELTSCSCRRGAGSATSSDAGKEETALSSALGAAAEALPPLLPRLLRFLRDLPAPSSASSAAAGAASCLAASD